MIDNILTKSINKKKYRKNNYRVPPNSKFYFLWVILVLLGIIFISNPYTPDLYMKSNKQQPQVSANQPNSKPLVVTQYATAFNTIYPLSLPKDVSFTLVEGWTSSNITILYDGVSHYKNNVINGDFLTDETPWVYLNSNPEIQDEGWNAGHIRIKIKRDVDIFKGDYGYFEENLSLNEILTPQKLIIFSMDYYFDPNGGTPPDNISAIMNIKIGEIEKNKTIALSNLVEKGWTRMSIIYDPITIGQYLPNTVSLRVGVVAENATRTVHKDQRLWIDNVELNLWTSINRPDLIEVYDNELDIKYGYENITYGVGKTFIATERNRNVTSEVVFTISKNGSFNEDFEIYNITIFSNNFKVFNSTYFGLDGSLYIKDLNIKWRTDCIISIPSSYLNNWVEIDKPTDWDITNVIDGYDTNQIESCSGNELGSEKLIIPVGVLSSGLWEIEAISQNYIIHSKLKVWNGISYYEESYITFGDKFQICVTLNESVPIINTIINCTIIYPNGTTFWLENKGTILPDTIFGNFTVGTNMSVGDYQVKVDWTNNISSTSRDKVGFYEFRFSVWHPTNFTAIDSYFEIFAGDPLLLKVKFMDLELNTPINFATVTYNSTFGVFGTMIYIGSGVYFTDLDTSSLEIGDYYFSFNASKSFYENQTVENLIHLKIVPQPLHLEVPNYALEGNANSIISCKIIVTGAISGSLIYPANISTDWFNSYNITDHNNGTYTLDFSTFNIPTIGHIDSYEIEIFANKTNYENVNDFISLLVHPLSTEAKANVSLVTINSNEIVNFKVNYTIEGSNELIIGSNCSVTWQGSSIISPVSDGFNIKLFTYGMPVDYYSALIKLNKAGFEDAFESVTIIIRAQNVNLNISINNQNIPENHPIEVSFNDLISISCRAFAETEGIYLSGGTVKFILDFHEIDLTESIDYWYNESLGISTNLFSLGRNYVYIKFELSNYTTTTFSFQILVSQIKINVKTIDFDDSINVYSGDRLTIWINLTESGSNTAIENATIYCYWEFGTFYFQNTGIGLYKLDLDVPTNILGTHRFNLVVTPKEDIYKTTEYSFLIIITEKQLPSYVFWIILISLISAIAIFGALSFRSYVILPRRRRRESLIADKTQPYKDIRNIQAILVSNRYSGTALFNKTFSILEENYISEFSSFIQAITILGNQYTKDGLKVVDIESNGEDIDEEEKEIKELDFNFFQSLICDYGELRIVLLLRERSSDGLRKIINLVTKEIFIQNKDLLRAFKGNLNPIRSSIELMLYRHLPLYYKEPFELNKSKHYHSVKVSGGLTNLEIRILNVLESQSKYKNTFLLDEIIGLIDDVNEDEMIITVESLIQQKMIRPME